MIPKVIHYCWFGGKTLPLDVVKCIDSWKVQCPDYKIIRWDENNFDINCVEYVKEAYEEKKWAFVSDYARLKIIYENGGIYLDTDVELLKNLDLLLNNKFFFAIEKDTNELHNVEYINVATGLGFGGEKHNTVILSLLEEYNNVHFKTCEGIDLTPCPVRNTKALEKFGYKNENFLQQFAGGTVYPADYFCPQECNSIVSNYSSNTLAIHHYSAPWTSKKEIRITKIKNLIRRSLRKIL